MEDAIVKMIGQDPELLIPILIFTIGGIIAIVAIVFGSVKAMVSSKEQERTRREIAAYIAEGSMTPEDGQRLLTGGPGGKKKNRCA